ncbi:MAG: hypothetical protein IPN22_09115 [Bacteroidetes bacterium]|nr:hypothetical protein [Bacteroidota bacterium]
MGSCGCDLSVLVGGLSVLVRDLYHLGRDLSVLGRVLSFLGRDLYHLGRDLYQKTAAAAYKQSIFRFTGTKRQGGQRQF